MTYTCATLEVSDAAYDEIAAKLRAAGYHHAFDEAGMIDMTHIGLVRAALSAEPAQPKALTDELLYDLIVGALEDRGAAWLMDDDDEFSQAKAILHVARAVIAADRASRLPEMGEGDIDAVIREVTGLADLRSLHPSKLPFFRRLGFAAVEAYKALVRGKT